MRPQRLTVVLVGQTGNGKSATANSLLGRDAFAARRSFASVTEGCARQVSWLDEDDALVASTSGDDAAGSVGEDVSRRTELCVIDTPGTCDSGALLEDNLAHISAHLRGEEGGATDAGSGAGQAGHERNTGEEKDAESSPLHESATSAPARVHMFVLVLSAAARFTQEEAIALERLFSRLGEDALRHACVAVTRAEEITRDAEGSNAKTFAAELAKSAPPGLRRLMERMPYHARGAPPVLVENFPTDAYARVADAARGGETVNEAETTTTTKTTLRFRAAAAPLLAAARDICEAVLVERGALSMSSAESPNTTTRLRTLNLASCAYEPEQLSRANAAAADDPSVAALAMLDRLKKQLAEGAFGGASGDADRDPNGMAAAARRAFEDLAAQFAARAAGGGGRAKSFETTFPPATESRNTNTPFFGGLFGGPSDASSDAAGRVSRAETAFAGAKALGGVFEDDAFTFSNDVTVRVSGFGDVREARGAFVVCAPGGRLAFQAKKKEKAPVAASDDLSTPSTPCHARGRARVSGRVSCLGGGFAFASAGERTAATMHSPTFLSSVGGPSRVFRASRPVSDDDWVEENAHFVTLTESSDASRNSDSSDASRDHDSIKIVVRGAKTGETPDVAFFLDADARFELQGGSLSVWNAAAECSFRSDTNEPRDKNSSDARASGLSLAFDGVLDVETDVEFAFGAAPAERRAAFREGQTSFPWREKADGPT
jgi:hypothetical protein